VAAPSRNKRNKALKRSAPVDTARPVHGLRSAAVLRANRPWWRRCGIN